MSLLLVVPRDAILRKRPAPERAGPHAKLLLDVCIPEAERLLSLRGHESEHEVVNIIETARLILRPWCADDLEELERLFADPAVRQGRRLPPERVIAIAQSSL